MIVTFWGVESHESAAIANFESVKRFDSTCEHR